MAAPESGQALSEVIGFILLLGVIVAAFSVWLIYVVPADGREQEIEQMNAVKDRFTDYKISLDSLWMNNQSGITLSTSFNLGTGGGSTEAGGLFMPLLRPQSSSAAVSVANNNDRLTINCSAVPIGPVTNMSVLEYRSANTYWIQQRYYYQLGGVFLAQDDGVTNRVSPGISIVSNSDTTVSVYIVPIQIDGGGSVGGNGPVRIDTRLRPLRLYNISQPNSFVNISVDVADNATARMWANAVLNETRIRGGLVYPGYYNISVWENPVTKRGVAYILINGPFGGSIADVYLTVRPVEYVVTLNSIASGLT